MSMQVLLTDIELDIQELKCLMDAFTREPNVALREVIKRNILQMRGRLDALLLTLDAAEPASEQKMMSEQKPVSDQKPMTMSEQKPTIEQKPVEEKPEVTPIAILGERIQTATELSRSISLNDSFRFSRELFDGDTEQMNRALQQIGEMSSYVAAVSFLTSKVKVNEENEAMVDLLELLKKYFN